MFRHGRTSAVGPIRPRRKGMNPMKSDVLELRNWVDEQVARDRAPARSYVAPRQAARDEIHAVAAEAEARAAKEEQQR